MNLKGSLPAPEQSLTATIVPNPANDIAYMNFQNGEAGLCSIEVVTPLGQQIYKESLGAMQNGSVKIDVSKLPAGVYFVTLTCGISKITKQLVKY